MNHNGVLYSYNRPMKETKFCFLFRFYYLHYYLKREMQWNIYAEDCICRRRRRACFIEVLFYVGTPELSRVLILVSY